MSAIVEATKTPEEVREPIPINVRNLTFAYPGREVIIILLFF